MSKAFSFPEKNIISHQFIKAAKQLIIDKKLSDQKALCEKYNYDKSLFNKIAGGEQNVPYDVLYEFVNDFNLNPAYFFVKKNTTPKLYL